MTYASPRQVRHTGLSDSAQRSPIRLIPGIHGSRMASWFLLVCLSLHRGPIQMARGIQSEFLRLGAWASKQFLPSWHKMQASSLSRVVKHHCSELLICAELERQRLTYHSFVKRQSGHLATSSRWDICLALPRGWLISWGTSHILSSALPRSWSWIATAWNSCTHSLCKFNDLMLHLTSSEQLYPLKEGKTAYTGVSCLESPILDDAHGSPQFSLCYQERIPWPTEGQTILLTMNWEEG
jgi:hypothetical protein